MAQQQSIKSASDAGPLRFWQRMSVQRLAGRLLLHAILILLGITFMVPLLWTLSTSFKHPGQVFTRPIQWIPQTLRWSNYQEVWTILPMPLFIRNTMVISVTALIGTLLSTSLCGYSFARLRWPGREKVFALVIGTMMLPGAVLLVPQFVLFRSLGWIDTFFPLIVPAWLGGGAFYIFLYRQFCSNIPYEMDEAAIMDGAGYFRIFWQITMAMSTPILAVVALQTFSGAWMAFMYPLIVCPDERMHVLAVWLQQFQQNAPGTAVFASIIVASAPSLLIFVFAQRTIMRGIAVPSEK